MPGDEVSCLGNNVNSKSEESRNLDQGENDALWKRLGGQIAC